MPVLTAGRTTAFRTTFEDILDAPFHFTLSTQIDFR